MFQLLRYYLHLSIKSATTIIATANPTGMKWNDPFKINNAEIPVLGTLLDRFDQIYAVNEFVSEEECRAYATRKAEMDERNIRYNYNFLKPYIKYARTINPTILPESRLMLAEFWLDLKRRNLASNRTLDSLFRVAKAQARLHLSHVVNEEIVTEIMEDYMQRMLQYGQIIKIIESPRDVTYREMLSIIKITRSPVELTEAARMACQKNEQINNYLGTRLTVKNNWKLRTVREMLLNHPSIKQVNDKPIVLLYSEEKSASFEDIDNIQSDVSEVCDDANAKTYWQPRTDSLTVSSNQVTGIQIDLSEVCDEGNDNESRISKVTNIQSDVSEVCDENKVKTSSQGERANLDMEASCQNNDSMINGTSHTSHTSPDLNVQEAYTEELRHNFVVNDTNSISQAISTQSDVSEAYDGKRLTLKHSPDAHIITNDDFENIEPERTKNYSVGSDSNGRGGSV